MRGLDYRKQLMGPNIFLEDISSFRGATDTLVLDFWWCLPCVSELFLMISYRHVNQLVVIVNAA